jgi:RimJ/RimL family protein N-acetyltransferase
VFAAYASDPVATRYLAWRPYSDVGPLAAFLQARAEDWENPSQRFAYLLCLAGTDEPIGSIAIHPQGSQAMLAYVLGQAHWGRGLMTEAVQFLADWALAQPEIYRVWAFCDAENPASARVMEKAGMAREGILRRWFACPNLGPEPRDCIVFARVK